MALPYPKVHVIINPAAGQDEPILNVLNDVFHPAGVAWEISLTHKSGDATRLAAEAAAAGVDLVAAYGGDGTRMEVANGLLGTGVPRRFYRVARATRWRTNSKCPSTCGRRPN